MQQLRDLSIYALAMTAADVVDILLVASLIYGLLYVVRGTRAIQLLRGILLVVLFVFVFNQLLPLPAFARMVSALLPAILVSIPVIFQPELRRAFERLGRAGLFAGRTAEASATQSLVNSLAQAAQTLAAARHGALVVIERDTALDDVAERGLPLDARVTPDLLVQVFHPNTPLHDGAVILRGDRMVAARAVLPLRDTPLDDPTLGTRHLAALSIAESTDALAVVVSEETGGISVAYDGEIRRCHDASELARRLHEALAARPTTAPARLRGWLGVGRRAPAGRRPGAVSAPDRGATTSRDRIAAGAPRDDAPSDRATPSISDLAGAVAHDGGARSHAGESDDRSPSGFLLDSISSALLALLLAFAIWLASTQGARPIGTATLPRPGDPPVPVVFADVPVGLAWYAPATRDIRLQVRGIRGAVDGLTTADFAATMDLSSLEAQDASFTGPLSLACVDAWRCWRQGVRVTGFQPAEMTVRIGRAISATHAVVVEPDADLPAGYALIRTTSEPAEVVISGAEVQIAQVARVVAPATGMATTRSRRRVEAVKLEPRDEYGRPVADVAVAPPTASVVLFVERRGVPVYVTPEYIGRVADGYFVTAFDVDPPFVQLEGLRERIDALNNLSPVVNISGLAQDLVTAVPLDLPEGVTALNAPGVVTVTVKVAPILDARSLDIPVVAQGAGAGLAAALKPDVVRVLLNGPRPVLESLSADDVVATVDLSGRPAGTYSLSPVVRPPEGVGVRSLQPARIEVVLAGRGAAPTSRP